MATQADPKQANGGRTACGQCQTTLNGEPCPAVSDSAGDFRPTQVGELESSRQRDAAYAPFVSRRQRRMGRRLLLGGSLIFILAVVGGEPVRLTTPNGTVENARLAHGLGLSPVFTDVAGQCPTKSSRTTIFDAAHDRCLTLASDGLRITSVRTIAVVDQGGFWAVTLQLEEPDEHALASLTKTLATNEHPRNELALIVHGPPGGLVLGAPVVAQSVNDLELDGGPSQASATSLRDLILE